MEARQYLSHWLDGRQSEITKAEYNLIVAVMEEYALSRIKEVELPSEPYKTTRVEVIDQNGRSYVNWDKKNKVSISMQDEDRTLKVFISR